MKIRCIALDLDRTTLNSMGHLSEENRIALEKIIHKGVQVILASGRALTTLPEEICKIEGIRYAVTSNGAAVYDIRSGECMHRYLMTEESVCRITKFAEERGLALEVFIEGKAYALADYVKDPVKYGATPKGVPYIQGTREPVEDIYGFALAHKTVLDSMDLIAAGEQEKEAYRAYLEKTVSDIYLTSSVTQLLEISYKDAGKHTGTDFLLKQLNLKPEELAAFGDGDNDAELLSYAGTGIAMANASKMCKEAADYVTRSNDENGLAYALENILHLTGQENENKGE